MALFGNKDRAEVYEDKAGQWRWRVISRNGKIVAASEQGYVKQSYAVYKVAITQFPIEIVVD